MPVSTSPVPPVAIPGLPVGLMAMSPDGLAITVRCPLSTTCTWWVAANSPAISTRLACTSSIERPSNCGHLARVRRDHDVALVAPREPAGVAGKRQHGVGVEDQRDR